MWSGWPLPNTFLTFTICCISLGARNFVRSDSRSAADTVGVNGIYVPVECILIIRGGIFEAAIQYVRTWNFHTVRHVCVTIRSWWLRFIRISGSLIRLVLSKPIYIKWQEILLSQHFGVYLKTDKRAKIYYTSRAGTHRATKYETTGRRRGLLRWF